MNQSSRTSGGPRPKCFIDSNWLTSQRVLMDSDRRYLDPFVSMGVAETARGADHPDRRAPILAGQRPKTELVVERDLVIGGRPRDVRHERQGCRRLHSLELVEHRPFLPLDRTLASGYDIVQDDITPPMT